MQNDKNNLLIISGSGAQGGAEKQLLNLINNLKETNIYLFVFNVNKQFLDSLNKEKYKESNLCK